MHFYKKSLSTSFDPEVIGLKDLITLRYSYINSAFFDTLLTSRFFKGVRTLEGVKKIRNQSMLEQTKQTKMSYSTKTTLLQVLN